MPYRLGASHLKTIAGALAGTVMPRASRQRLVEVLGEVFADTSPKDRARNVKPESAYTGRKHRQFGEQAEPVKRVEIVVNVSTGVDGRSVSAQSWELHVWEDHWGHLTVVRPEEDSFQGAVELAMREYFVRDLASVSIRFA